jgi:hypothetical protein
LNEHEEESDCVIILNNQLIPTDSLRGCCSICLDEDIKMDSITKPCGHAFHNTCIKDWMDIEQSCPNCRTNIITILIESSID